MNAYLREPMESVPVVSEVVAVDDLVRRAQQGDVDAFEQIYRQHASKVFAVCLRMTGDDGQSRELVQDVFVRAWERLTTFRGQSALATWLHRLAVNITLEHLRTSRRDGARLIEGTDTHYGSHSTAGQIEARMDLNRALSQLPDGARTVFVLHDIEGYSHDEIAAMTGIAAGTARAQLWRARRALMKVLAI